jgi:hypothetical protein
VRMLARAGLDYRGRSLFSLVKLFEMVSPSRFRPVFGRLVLIQPQHVKTLSGGKSSPCKRSIFESLARGLRSGLLKLR